MCVAALAAAVLSSLLLAGGAAGRGEGYTYSCTDAPTLKALNPKLYRDAPKVGKLYKIQVAATSDCGDGMVITLFTLDELLQQQATLCPTEEPPERRRRAGEFSQAASQAEDLNTKIAKAHDAYYREEADWYRDKKNKKLADEIDTIADDFGKFKFKAETYWGFVKADARANLANDCAGVEQDAGQAKSAATDAQDAFSDFHRATRKLRADLAEKPPR
jgi:hypothetical protein